MFVLTGYTTENASIRIAAEDEFVDALEAGELLLTQLYEDQTPPYASLEITHAPTGTLEWRDGVLACDVED